MSLDNQTVFDTGLQGIRNQNYQRSTDGSVCLYRGPRGLKCIVGHCVPDDLVDDASNERGILRQLLVSAEWASFFKDVNKELLRAMQDAHDVSLAFSVSEFESEMKRIAFKFNLRYNYPTKHAEEILP